jgi:hypothetical protein
MSAHLRAYDHVGMDPTAGLYTIRIRGRLGAMVLMAFPELAPRSCDSNTLLTGVLDRSALFGVLAEVEALGLELLEVRLLSPHDQQADSDGSCP